MRVSNSFHFPVWFQSKSLRVLALVKSHAFSFLRLLHSNTWLMASQSFGSKDHAQLYAKHRPSYPDAMFEEIFKYCTSEKPHETSLDLAVDVGCGSGQSTRPFCRYFRHVIGTDVSEQQIKSAIAKTNEFSIDKEKSIEFKACPSEDLSFLENDSADLVTAAQAFQWFNFDLFNAEVRRVLKPGGTFAAFGYGINVLDDPEANKLQNEVKFFFQHFNVCRGLLYHL